jgi:nicotinamidase-related amidase
LSSIERNLAFLVSDHPIDEDQSLRTPEFHCGLFPLPSRIGAPGASSLILQLCSPFIQLEDSTVTDHEKMQAVIANKQLVPLRLDREKCALIVVDVQRFFADPEAAFARTLDAADPGITDGYFSRVQSVLPKIAELEEGFRGLRLPVIFTIVGSETGDRRDLVPWIRDLDELSVALRGEPANPVVNGWSWQVMDQVSPAPGEVVLNKKSSGAFASTALGHLLHSLGITSVVVCGLTTSICVAQTAREAADAGFRSVIASDACTEMSEEMHDLALISFCHAFGQARETREIVDFLAVRTGADASLEEARM